jgi:predicted dehydrogenase
MRRYVEWDSPWMADKPLAGGGALLNLGGHGFDMARFITGEELQVASAVVSRQVHGGQVEDYAIATLRGCCCGKRRAACSSSRRAATNSFRSPRIGKRVTRGRSMRHWKLTAAAILRRYRRASARTPSA